MNLSDVLNSYQHLIPNVIQREPLTSEKNRWVKHRIGDIDYLVAQPVTFTPYASATACSARCLFCSENLREEQTQIHSSLLRPSDLYFSQLGLALQELRGLPISYSLSGLEMTDDKQWFIKLMGLLSSHDAKSPVEQKVLYSNGSGFVDIENDEVFSNAIESFGLTWIELSRHHFDDVKNQNIMRFRSGNKIASNASFAKVIANVQKNTSIKLVCILQHQGIDDLPSLITYLDWAKVMGVSHVIFRELSVLDETYKANRTFNYIASSRVSVGELLKAFLERYSPEIKYSTNGYYFSNLVVEHEGIDVTFESSNYTDLRNKHDSGKIFKLIFHANGNLCADWNPDKHVLFSSKGLNHVE
ncbi:MAG: hypothetical protein ABW044_01710 [Cellvibrio sp.]